MDTELIKYFLPDGILDHYIITNIEETIDARTQAKVLRIDLEEINELPTGYEKTEYESKGFYLTTYVKDFPIRDRALLLALKRRRWRNKNNKNEIIHNDYSFIAAGAKITQDLSDFLKETD